MRYLALDVGSRRIGVAVGSSELRIATPLAVVERTTLREDSRRLRELAAEYDAQELVAGLPREVDGSIGAQAQTVVDYVEALRRSLELPITLFDERYSTVEALALRREAGISEKRGRPTIDAAAAAVILQGFLDALPSQDRDAAKEGE